MSTKKRILFFTKDLNRTGAEVILFNIIEKLDRSKFDIGVVVMQKGGELIANLPKDISLFFLESTFNLSDKIRFHFGEDVMLKRLKKIQQEFKSDIWYINTIDNAYLLKYKEQFPVKTCLHVHEFLYNFEQIASQEIKLVIEKTDQVIGCSVLVEKLFKPLLGNKYMTFQSAIDTHFIETCLSEIKPTSTHKKRIVSSGTLCYRKGLDIFLEVSTFFTDSNVEFIWLGKWPKNGYAELLQFKINAGEFPNVQILDQLNHQEYVQTMQSADLFLSCSREESMGLVMMEAIYCGVPVLATDSGGSSLIVNDQNGKICFDSRPATLANEVQHLIENHSQFDPASMRKSIEKYDGTLEIQKLEMILSKI
jgi:glycosyltransferase involved in cell wall biosynthesis